MLIDDPLGVIRHMLPVSLLEFGCHPLSGSQWGIDQIDIALVMSMTVSSSYDFVHHSYDDEYLQHCSKIAWLMKFGWQDPISIDVGVPSLGYHHANGWVMEDGYHRLCAAVIRDDKMILVEVGGEIDVVPQVFPGAIELPPVLDTFGYG